MKKIVATSWHAGGANAIASVIKRLIKERRAKVVVIGHKVSEKIFKRENIDYETIYSYELEDVSLGSMIRLLQIESPDLVLTGTSSQDKNNRDIIEQTITFAARNMGIKSVAVLDFWAGYSERFSNIFADEKFKFLPDKIAILDELARKAMLKEGFPEERLVITGNPYFDSLIEQKTGFRETDKQKVRADLGIFSDACVLLFASQPIKFYYGESLGYTEETVLEELLETLEKIKGKKICLLVKVHPMEKEEDIKKRTLGYSFPIVVDQAYPPRQAILASDIVISTFSTMLIESVHLGKPSISLQPGLKTDDLLITNRSGITLPVYQQGKIGAVLDKLLYDKNYASELLKKSKDFRTDGKATERVVKLIYKMLF